jgi:hypothetical protein
MKLYAGLGAFFDVNLIIRVFHTVIVVRILNITEVKGKCIKYILPEDFL